MLLLVLSAGLLHAGPPARASDNTGETGSQGANHDSDSDSDGDSDSDATAGESEEVETADAGAGDAALPQERQVAIEDQLVSVFENNTPTIQYGYIENLGDGRGFTAGRAGFTSATGDLLQVVETYSATNPGNVLEQYLPALRRVNGSDSVEGLDGFPAAWAAAAGGPSLKQAQDKVNDELYRQPARKFADELGAKLPLTKAALYEAGIQHGFGDDADSVTSIARRATEAVGGNPASGADEKEWLRAFLQERRKNLLSPANRETAREWKESVGRADAMLSLFDSGNLHLDGKITLEVFGSSHVL